MNKKTAIVLSLSALVLGGLVFSKTANAYRGDPAVKGPDYSEERHEAMTQAFGAGDYGAWKDLMQGKGRVTQVVNEDNFSRFVEAHRLALEGKMDEAREIRAELDLGLGNGSGNGEGRGMGRGMHKNF